MFSLLIPFHNEEKTLPVLFKSLRTQQDKHFNVVLVNNNSTDESVPLIKSVIGKVEFHVTLLHEKSNGQIFALQKGVHHVMQINSNSFVATFDADSHPESDSWTQSVNLLLNHCKSNIGYISGPINYETNRNTPIWNRITTAHDSTINQLMEKIGWFCCMSNSVFPARILQNKLKLVQTEPFEKDLKIGLSILKDSKTTSFNPEVVVTSPRRLLINKSRLMMWANDYEAFAQQKNRAVRNASVSFDLQNTDAIPIFKGRSRKLVFRNLIPVAALDRTNMIRERLISYFDLRIQERVFQDLATIKTMLHRDINEHTVHLATQYIAGLRWPKLMAKVTANQMLHLFDL